MFWGLIMEPERRYTQKVKKAFHISMAAMDISSSGDEPSQVMCGYDGRNYLLCTLRKPDMIQSALDLEFAEGTEVSFASNGKAHIHLTGYLTDMDGLADLEEENEEVEEEQKATKKKKKAVENGPPAKKAKIINGLNQEDDSDEDDDSDEAEDEAEDEEQSNDEEAEDEEESGEEEESDESEEDTEEEEAPSKPVKNKKQQEVSKQPMANGEKKKKVEQQKPGPKKVKLDQGVVIEDLKVGDGPEARSGKFVTVYYEGRLEKNNKMFDSSTKGPGFKFRLGKQEVIKGWDLGVAGMKVGGKRKILCPPHTAYGAKGSPPVIPPNSTLVFTVELKKVN